MLNFPSGTDLNVKFLECQKKYYKEMKLNSADKEDQGIKKFMDKLVEECKAKFAKQKMNTRQFEGDFNMIEYACIRACSPPTDTRVQIITTAVKRILENLGEVPCSSEHRA